MNSRTPIRLTPYRGPLATPSTSPESSPVLLTPPSDLPLCSAAVKPSLDVAILQHRISSLNSPPGYQLRSRLYRWRREVAEQELSCVSGYLCRGAECLVGSVWELVKVVAGIFVFCLLIWGVLEWSSCVSTLPRQPGIWLQTSRRAFPSSTRYLRCHVNPSLCESRDQHAAVLQFLSEQIQHAKAMATLSVGLDAPLRTFFEAHRATIHQATALHSFPENTLANLTELLDPPILDFAPGSFIGRSFTLALEELDDLVIPHASFPHQDAHVHAIYWRTASNLLLEYSAARPRARKLLQHVHVLHQQLSPLVPGITAVERLNARWWKGIVRLPTATVADEIQTFVAGLQVTLDNVQRLVAYLDWITEHLAHTTLGDVLGMRRGPDMSSCMTLLQELFARSKPLRPKQHGFRWRESPTRLDRVEMAIPGSRTINAGR